MESKCHIIVPRFDKLTVHNGVTGGMDWLSALEDAWQIPVGKASICNPWIPRYCAVCPRPE